MSTDIRYERFSVDVGDLVITLPTGKKFNEHHDDHGRFASSDGEGETAPSGGKLFSGGSGADHYEHVNLSDEAARTQSPNVVWTGPGPYDYSLRPGTDVYPTIHPDEPHTSRDAEWPQAFVRSSGGGYIDTSPAKQPAVNSQALRYWSTSGSKRAENQGGYPHNGVIREAADQHFGVTGGGRVDVIDRLDSEKYNSFAKSFVDSIAKAEPAQPTLWRGIHDDQARSLIQSKVGDSVEFTLASTSRDANVARGYAGIYDTSDKSKSAIMRIEAGSRGVANRKYFDHDQEVITGGHYVITNKSMTKDGVHIIDLKQTKVNKW